LADSPNLYFINKVVARDVEPILPELDTVVSGGFSENLGVDPINPLISVNGDRWRVGRSRADLNGR